MAEGLGLRLLLVLILGGLAWGAFHLSMHSSMGVKLVLVPFILVFVVIALGILFGA